MKTQLCKYQLITILSALCISCLLSAPGTVLANDNGNDGSMDLHLTTGVSIVPIAMFGAIPMPVAVTANLDMGKMLRLSLDFTHHVIVGLSKPTAGAGIVFRPVGKDAPRKGGFQLKLPITAEVGVMIGDVEVDDGHDDTLRWVVLGPSIGADFVWWKAGKAGFCTSLKGSYMFKVADFGSDYSDYGFSENNVGAPLVSVMFGVAL